MGPGTVSQHRQPEVRDDASSDDIAAKEGLLETNVFDRIEVSAKQGESHKTATPAECKLLWDSGNWNIRLLL